MEQHARLDNVEIETQLLDKGYCDADITKARPGIVQITVREKALLIKNPLK